MAGIVIDEYIVELLMRDLVKHDKSPPAFLVYLHMWGATLGRVAESAALSHQQMTDSPELDSF